MSDATLKRLVFACALAAAPGQAAAQAVPATPAATPAAAKAPEPLGRMFFTPAQRAQLDVARTQRARTTLATEKTEEIVTAAPVAQSITYDGMVRRSDGKSTVWLNSRPVNDKESAGAVVVGRIRADGGVSLQMPQSGRTVELKPGQSIELLSGAIEESFSRRPAAQPESKPAPKPVPDAKAAASSDRAKDERDREDRERQLDEAARALRDAATAKPAAAPSEAPR
jgi:hypothetical protein